MKELFDNDMFGAARDEIAGILGEGKVSASEELELATYAIVCNIRLGSPNIDALMDEYVENYRYAPEYMSVRLMYAGYYFDR